MRALPVLLLSALAILTIAPAPADAKASFMKLPELLGQCDVVAVVDVTGSLELREPVPKGRHWRYRQKNLMRFRELLVRPRKRFRRTAPHVVYARKDFICAQASYSPGRYLVFLESVGADEWVTVNHHLGALRIEGEMVEWYKRYSPDRAAGTLRAGVKLDEARRAIRAISLKDVEIRFEAVVVPPARQPKWRPGEDRQGILLEVPNPPDDGWPPDVGETIEAVAPKTVIPDARTRDAIAIPGKAKVRATWKDGVLVIDSIKPIRVAPPPPPR